MHLKVERRTSRSEGTITVTPSPSPSMSAIEELPSIALPGDTHQEGVLIQPVPCYVIKTKLRSADADGDKLFINVASSNAIAAPSTKKRLDAEGKEVEGLNVPVSVGSIRSCTDKAGKPALAIDVIVSPKIIQDNKEEKDSSPLGMGGSGSRDFLNQFIMQCVEQKCNTPASASGQRGPPLPSSLAGAQSGGPVTVDRKYTLPKLSYQGYVHSITGLPVDKSSEFAEVAKQMVRDAKNQPVIEEVEPSRSTGSPEPTVVSNSSKASEPMPPIECSMSIEMADGTIKPLSDYIEGTTNASLGGDALVVTVDPALSSHSNGSLLLIGDASKSSNNPALEAQVVHLECQTTSCPDLEAIRVDVSAYAVSVTSKGHSPIQCITPIPIDTGSATCSYNATSSTLSVRATVVADDTIDCPDVGSHPWMLQKGLSSKKEKNATSSRNIGSKKKNSDEKRGESAIQDDKGGDGVFPEDRFHARDAYSQHMLLKQKEEQSGRKGVTPNGHEKDSCTTEDVVDNVIELF